MMDSDGEAGPSRGRDSPPPFPSFSSPLPLIPVHYPGPLPQKRGQQTPEDQNAAKRARLDDELNYWTPFDNPVEETADLVLDGEPENEEPQEAVDEDDLPCRKLDDFVAYDMADSNLMMIPVESLDAPGDTNPIFEGIIRPVEVEDDLASDDGTSDTANSNRPTRFKSSAPYNWGLYLTPSGPQIWIRTYFSWIRLGRPHPTYAPFFETISKTGRFAWRIVSALQANPDTTFDYFVKNCLKTPFIVPTEDETSDLFGKEISPEEEIDFPLELTSDDLLSLGSEIILEIECSLADEGIDLPRAARKSDLYKKVLGNSKVEKAPRIGRATGRPKNMKASTGPVWMTPRVAAAERKLFGGQKQCLKIPGEDYEEPVLPPYSLSEPPVPNMDVDHIEWIGESNGADDVSKRVFFSAAEIVLENGERKHVERGSLIIVDGEEEDGSNKRVCFFGQVLYLFEDRSQRLPNGEYKKLVHVRYFHLAQKTFLKELGRPRELFLLNSCFDLDMDTICGFPSSATYIPPRVVPDIKTASRAELVAWLKENVIPEWAEVPWGNDHANEEYRFVYRMLYDEKELRTQDAREVEDEWDDRESRCCKSCEHKDGLERKEKTFWLRNANGQVVGIRARNGVDVFPGDFVLLHPGVGSWTYDIGRVERFAPCAGSNRGSRLQFANASDDIEESLLVDREPSGINVHVRLFLRKDVLRFDYLREQLESPGYLSNSPYPEMHSYINPHELYLSAAFECYDALDVAGICRVVHLSELDDADEFSDKENCNFFYDKLWYGTNDTEIAPVLHEGARRTKLREADEASRRLFEQVRELLKAFELFCGAGGLAEGMEQADAMESKFHLDHFEAAAKTFEKNILGSKAAVSEASTFLNRLFKKVVLGQDVADGDFLELLKDVEWVNAGPPCPGFSRMNHHRRSDDSRNALIGTFLSIIEILLLMNPEFKGLLFENVQEILRFPAGAANVNGRLFGGIPAGAVKFIERILQDLDFRNTRKAVMNAGHYGTPEKRMRFFFVATRSGMPMPSWPKPSTVFDKGSSTTSANIYYGPDSSAYSVYGDPEPCAPHSQLLEIVAMSDLPGFEYKDVHLQAQPSAAELEAEQERRQRLPTYSTGYMKKNGYAGKMQQAYIRQPQSNYQRLMRKNLGSDDKLHGHISKGLSDMMTERVCKVELEPGASHLSLPTRMVEEILRGSGRGTHASKWKLKGLYRRHDYLDSFPTATTKLDPGQKMGTILHPSQRRIISVREYARSQGFGDDFIFCVDKKDKKLGVVDSMLRQIGNAVPVPLAKAIGAEIKEACFRQWLAERE